jgi:hypothetical protein
VAVGLGTSRQVLTRLDESRQARHDGQQCAILKFKHEAPPQFQALFGNLNIFEYFHIYIYIYVYIFYRLASPAAVLWLHPVIFYFSVLDDTWITLAFPSDVDSVLCHH